MLGILSIRLLSPLVIFTGLEFLFFCKLVFAEQCTKEDLKYTLRDGCAYKPLFVEVPGGKKAQCTVRVNLRDFATQPVVKFADADEDEYYVLAMIDPDAPGHDALELAWLHWLKVNVKGQDLLDGVDGGQELREYKGPGAPPGTGIHRYEFFIIPQDGKRLGLEKQERPKFSLKEFLAERDVCSAPVASTGFLAAHEDVSVANQMFDGESQDKEGAAETELHSGKDDPTQWENGFSRREL